MNQHETKAKDTERYETPSEDNLGRFSVRNPISSEGVKYIKTNPSEPSLLLQEIAHFTSLLSAVALSTLRNDVECVESPLAVFKAGDPWPPVDPDENSSDFRQNFYQTTKAETVLKYLFGISRTSKMRTLYNAARPFRVIGGVSHSEMDFLQSVRGPQAKVALCSFWLQELVTREQLKGGLGKVP